MNCVGPALPSKMSGNKLRHSTRGAQFVDIVQKSGGISGHTHSTPYQSTVRVLLHKAGSDTDASLELEASLRTHNVTRFVLHVLCIVTTIRRTCVRWSYSFRVKPTGTRWGETLIERTSFPSFEHLVYACHTPQAIGESMFDFGVISSLDPLASWSIK